MIKDYLSKLYPDRTEELYEKIQGLIAAHQNGIHRSYRPVSKSDIMLITYGDSIQRKGERPLQTLKDFLDEELGETVTCVHLLPMFPYTSDDGFSVTDFRRIDPKLGTWEDISRLGETYDLMYDAVINHVSRSSIYFKEFSNGNPKYKDYFIEADPDADYRSVTRPRTLPLIHKYDTAEGKKSLWTTFSEDQIDLNFKNPDVLLEILDVLLLYAERGARFIRLDAVGFIWKELGTSCMHLPQTHILIKLIHAVLEQYGKGITIITETNVPQKENISYFGNGYDEAGMVYQFPLPPLTLYSYLSGNAAYLSRWASSLEIISENVTYFNFLASHDGIGMRPVEDILSREERKLMEEEVIKRGGKVSYRTMPDGSQVPYELNISYLDAVAGDISDQHVLVKKYMGSQCILLSVIGMPAIYYHSLLGSRNSYKEWETSGINRRINREKLDADKLQAELQDAGSLRAQVLGAYRRLIKIRKEEDAFEPNSPQRVLNLDERVFSIVRGEKGAQILVLVNVSGEKLTIETGISGKELISDRLTEHQVEMEPYDYMWIKG